MLMFSSTKRPFNMRLDYYLDRKINKHNARLNYAG